MGPKRGCGGFGVEGFEGVRHAEGAACVSPGAFGFCASLASGLRSVVHLCYQREWLNPNRMSRCFHLLLLKLSLDFPSALAAFSGLSPPSNMWGPQFGSYAIQAAEPS